MLVGVWVCQRRGRGREIEVQLGVPGVAAGHGVPPCSQPLIGVDPGGAEVSLTVLSTPSRKRPLHPTPV
ncbi:hypothetical protein FQA47_013175 [Oryzias melastigma]|uniref:Uncharacterized protein n=1 Tax=Oryzias melastigma TaxID=30732 RepID=A0A834KUZ6_ORYME|nr:hypothetical protein FQA47_013175 [Oryzias melastigma]